MTQDAIADLGRIERYPRAPVKRAAYSDRTAWLMAVLSELAYMPFDQDDDSSILSLARELAELTNRDEIAERLVGVRMATRGTVRVCGEAGCGVLRGGAWRRRDWCPSGGRLVYWSPMNGARVTGVPRHGLNGEDGAAS